MKKYNCDGYNSEGFDAEGFDADGNHRDGVLKLCDDAPGAPVCDGEDYAGATNFQAKTGY